MQQLEENGFIPSLVKIPLKRYGGGNLSKDAISNTDRGYRIVNTWPSGEKVGTNGSRAKGSVTMIIPKIFCEKYGFTAPSNVVVIDTGDGILIKPLTLNGL